MSIVYKFEKKEALPNKKDIEMSSSHEDTDEEVYFVGSYEDGHWEWDDAVGGLSFISDFQREPRPTDLAAVVEVQTGALAFNDDLDVLEQMRFRTRYSRKLKPGEPDVITLQDVKDLALFTAPLALLSDRLIDMLHTPTTERFIRALILYCQYYLQVEEQMRNRIQDLERKARTPHSDVVEEEFRENLCDLRSLVKKEYSIVILGCADTKKFHHMGSRKKQRSLAHRDAKLFESLLRFCIQIVWLALSRKSFATIELEINRLFKSEYFNSVEHRCNTGYFSNMSKEQRRILLGNSERQGVKLNCNSPVSNEQTTDYELLGLGVIKYNYLSERLRYMYVALVGPESELATLGVSLGILGFSRTLFDHRLRTLESTGSREPGKSKSSVTSQRSRSMYSVVSIRSKSSLGTGSAKKSKPAFIYKEIVLPRKTTLETPFPPEFPEQALPALKSNDAQRLRWRARLSRLKSPSKSKRTNTECALRPATDYLNQQLLLDTSVVD